MFLGFRNSARKSVFQNYSRFLFFTFNDKWKKLAEKELKTDNVEAKLVKQKDEGFAVKPVYAKEDFVQESLD